jgi:hypothetical protein
MMTHQWNKKPAEEEVRGKQAEPKAQIATTINITKHSGHIRPFIATGFKRYKAPAFFSNFCSLPSS